jgi:glucose-1-phosphate thymidylyltransferase
MKQGELDEMRGITLASNKGRRLQPLSKMRNKHLLRVGNDSMVLNPTGQLISVGIREIGIVTSTERIAYRGAA